MKIFFLQNYSFLRGARHSKVLNQSYKRREFTFSMNHFALIFKQETAFCCIQNLYTSVLSTSLFFRFEKANNMFKMKIVGTIYTGNYIQLTRSPYVLFPKSKLVVVNDAKRCKNFHANSKSVAEFYDKKSVVITGANGFIGTILVSKLLRSCPGLETIYFLLREKNGSSIQTRMDKLFKLPVSHYYMISTLRRNFSYVCFI